MILEKQTEAQVLQSGDSQDSVKMSLDLDSAQVLMQMLSKNLYSDAIGSTIRECASNALDSHRRAGVTEPIVVSLRPTKDYSYEFSVEDFGIGLDADDVKNIISKYGKSTKRDSNTELGMMGLGFKAPLAYSSSFYFIARKNGMERKYMMYEGDDVNTIDLLYEAPTDKRNGVKVIVPVKYGERYNFERKISEQLAYFESVYFDMENMDNNFTITRHEHFQYSPLVDNSKMHICLDNVYYPIDYEKLGMKSAIYCPVALRFSLTDGIFPTPNRESIRYTREAIEMIKKRMAQVADYFIDIYNEENKNTENAISYLKALIKNERSVKMKDFTVSLNMLEEVATKKIKFPTLNGLDDIKAERIKNIWSEIMNEYDRKFTVRNGKVMSHSNNRHSAFSMSDIVHRDNKFYIYSDKLTETKKAYLRQIHTRDQAIIVKKARSFKLGKISTSNIGNNDEYITLLGLKGHPKEKWRKMIQDFQKFQQMLMKDFIDLDTLEIPQTFLDSRKKPQAAKVAISVPKEKKKKLQGEVVGRVADSLERYSSESNCKFVSNTIQMQNSHRYQTLTVYGDSGWQPTMDKLFKPFGNKVRFILFSNRELDRLKDLNLHNWIKMDKFMEGEHIVFKRAATSFLIKKLQRQYRNVFDKLDIMKDVSIDLHNEIKILDEYADKYNFYSDDDLNQAIIEIATKKNMFDTSVYSTYLKMKDVLDSFPFIETLFSVMISSNGERSKKYVDILVDQFKYHRQRVNLNHYKIKLNEEVIQTPISEELVNEIL